MYMSKDLYLEYIKNFQTQQQKKKYSLIWKVSKKAE